MLALIQDTLQSLRPVTLVEMDSIKLMSRSDEKYLCRIDELPNLLRAAQRDFQVLENVGKRIFGYESMYLDTPRHEIYLAHHNGKLNRYKVRIREYQETGELFFEIKFKNNKRETRKKRIAIGRERDYHSAKIMEFMIKHSPYVPEMLQPVLFSSFKRITLVNHAFVERITIDLIPAWQFDGRLAGLPRVVIMEVKSERPTSASGFGHLLREARIMPHRISKYCIGTALLYPEIKHNQFKSKLLQLNRINNITIQNESYHAII